ncbi:hypothetical protein BGZ80_007677, partial [Entomortierella chlamydospora]
MLRNLFSSKTSNLSPEEALELVNEHLGLASKEDDIAKKLKLVNSANSRLKDAENIFVSKKVKDLALTKGIAHAYHEHGRLLDDLDHHDKAKKSHSKAEKWGYVHILIHQDHILPATPAKVNDGEPTPNNDGMQIQQKIFDQNITPPIA